MTQNNRPLATPQDLVEALALLTRLPLRMQVTRGARAAWAWPLAGVVVALLAAGIGCAGLALGLPPGLAAALVLATQIVATGALHEDGLADMADGVWGGQDRARRLEIMKDSRIGAYGVLALGLALIARWASLSALIAAGWLLAPLIAAAALSRAPMVVLMAALPNARGAGLASSVGRPARQTALLAVAVALLAALFTVGGALLAPLLGVSLATIALAAIARQKIGGQTGDVLGASQQVAEIVALAAFASLA